MTLDMDREIEDAKARGDVEFLARHLVETRRELAAVRHLLKTAPLTSQTFTVDETAKLLGISRALACQAVNSGELPAIRLRGRILVPRDRLFAFIGGARSR